MTGRVVFLQSQETVTALEERGGGELERFFGAQLLHGAHLRYSFWYCGFSVRFLRRATVVMTIEEYSLNKSLRLPYLMLLF